MDVNDYLSILLKYNREVNLISRNLSRSKISEMIEESLMVYVHLRSEVIVDAGSGNGILGIPLSIIDSEKKHILVETRSKKCVYLTKMVEDLGLFNVTVYGSGIKNYFNENSGIGDVDVVSRGFPDNNKLIELLNIDRVKRVVLISILEKVTGNIKLMENVEKYVYNIPSKDKLKIIVMEKVSRETFKKV